jgi:CheY-like chemotaxis protein
MTMNLDNITLSSIYKKKKSDRDIFHELMPFKVKEVLLIATVYDSYSIVREGQISDKIFGEYLQLNLYAAPRFTSASTMEEAITMLTQRDFDVVIIMAGLDKSTPVRTARAIHQKRPAMPILLLVNNNADLLYFQAESNRSVFFDRTFVWNGNSNVFLAMIKYIEDQKNLAPDTQLGNVRVVLLVEDSIQYYSRYLPMLYATIMTQTQNLVEDESATELSKIVKMRARPKVVLVSTYEDAIKIIDSYRDYILCVISDVKFERKGAQDDNAGIELLRYVNRFMRFPIPLLLQSHDISNAERAHSVGADFIDKNSDSLALDILNFLYRRLGFGSFVFKDLDGTPLMEAHNLQEFEEMFRIVPDSALEYHGRRNSFSTWLMARGEINMADRLKPYQTEDFGSSEDLRQFCLNVFHEVRLKKLQGRIIKFESGLVNSNRYVVRLGKGSLGGKGRGMSFMSHFIENIDFSRIINGMSIRIPATAVLGAVEFDRFIESNNLYENIYSSNDYESIRNQILEAVFEDDVNERLMEYLTVMKSPLAIRSSGLFEDSLLRPFSGVYSTFLISNNHPDIHVRFQQLVTAIKLVYASIFTESARNYFDAIDYKIEEEKMAVIIQEVVGHEFNGKYYPHISGIAQSYNYYPVAYMEPEDGFSVIAVGLGMYVAGGENAYRYCPRYPTLNSTSLRDQIRESQRHFYALDMSKSSFNLVKEGEHAAVHRYRIREAEADGTLEMSVSTYNMENEEIVPGMPFPGPRVVDFANILKYNSIPLSDTLQVLLKLFREAMGTPVEMEYAIDLKPGEKGVPTFYLLQIKPLIRCEEEVDIEAFSPDQKDILMYAERGMGNGRVSNIRDVVFVEPHQFSNLITKEIASQISQYNKLFEEENREYILIGPGRWGSNDHFTGIPVYWAGISKARVIIEIGLHNFPLEGSLGSHFFHNVTSMNVGYFSIPHHSKTSFINMDILSRQEIVRHTGYIRHVRFDQPLTVLMDGRKRQAVIRYENNITESDKT